MSAEYIRLTAPELAYGETNLLESEVSLLTIMQQYEEYKTLRKEELFLKIELKKEISELKEFLDTLAKILPESKLEEEQAEKERIQRELAEKIESVVEKSKMREWKYWREKEPVAKRQKETITRELEEQPKKSSIETELEDIRKRLSKLQ